MTKTSKMSRNARLLRNWAVGAACAGLLAAGLKAADQLNTGKKISPVGTQQNVGSLPMNLITSPDGKYAIATDMGFREQLTSLRTSDGTKVSSITYGDPASLTTNTNGLYYGLAFGSNGKLYAAQGENQTIAVVNLDSSGNLTQVDSIATKKGDFPSGLAADKNNHLYVANNDPDTFAQPTSVSVYDIIAKKELGRYTFSSSFGGTPNFPLAIATLADGSKTYVASQRDAAVYVLDTSDPTNIKLLKTLNTGSHPIALLLDSKQKHLFVANAHSDTVSEINTASDTITATLLIRPTRLGTIPGVTPTGLALDDDEDKLFVTLGDLNAVAEVKVDDNDLDFLGYIPVGWYPTGVVLGGGGHKLLVSNAKGVQAKYPNPGYKQWVFNQDPQYDLNLIEGTVSTLDIPEGDKLDDYTQQVLENNGVADEDDDGHGHGKGHDKKKDKPSASSLAFDHRLDSIGLKAGKIKHIIYIVKENRTYDQVLGDEPAGNGQASLALFGKSVTPNLHALAERFVLLDNFYDCGEASGDGWPWSTQAMASEYVIKNLPYNYSGRGRNYDFEGQDNGYPVGGFPKFDPDGKPLSDAFPNGLPPIPDVALAPGGHIWDAVQKAGLSFRNYGFFCNFGVTQKVGANTITIIPDNYPADGGLQPAGHDLAGISDFDFRRYDAAFADSDATYNYGDSYPLKKFGKHNAQSRFQEWNTEFQEMLKNDPTGNSVPAYMQVRFMHDHTQGMSPGVHSPRAQVADNDYGCAQLVDAISKSAIWDSTAIFIIEDDSQDGPDHVDVHRSTCYVISPWIKKSSVDHTFYNTDSVLKTMEMLLGIGPLTSYDAIANPILDWDNSPSNNAPFNAIPEDKTIVTEINPAMVMLQPGDKRIELVKMSEKMDFDHPDSAPAAKLNEIIWKSVFGADATMPPLKKGVQVAVAKKSQANKSKDKDD